MLLRCREACQLALCAHTGITFHHCTAAVVPVFTTTARRLGHIITLATVVAIRPVNLIFTPSLHPKKKMYRLNKKHREHDEYWPFVSSFSRKEVTQMVRQNVLRVFQRHEACQPHSCPHATPFSILRSKS